MKKVLLLSLMCIFALAANAVSYYVWVGNVQVTDANKDDVFGDNTVFYHPESKTLTLKNYNWANKKGIYVYGGTGAVISSLDSTLNVNLIGQNIMYIKDDVNFPDDKNAKNQILRGFFVPNGMLKFVGSGSLSVNIQSGYQRYAAYAGDHAYSNDCLSFEGTGRIQLTGKKSQPVIIPEMNSSKVMTIPYNEKRYSVAWIKKENSTIDNPSASDINKAGKIHEIVLAPNKKEDYDVRIMGSTVCSTNADDVFSDGTVKWNNSTKVLTLTNANLHYPVYGGIELGQNDASSKCFDGNEVLVNVNGNCSVSGYFGIQLCNTNARITLSGEGTKLNVHGYFSGIHCDSYAPSTVSIDNWSYKNVYKIEGGVDGIRTTNVIFARNYSPSSSITGGQVGIEATNIYNGHYASEEYSTVPMFVMHNYITVSGGNEAIYANNFNINKVASNSAYADYHTIMTAPKGAHFVNHRIYDANSKVAKSVTFGKVDEVYPVHVGGVLVHSRNKSDIFGDGTASYDNTTNTVTLNNLKIQGDNYMFWNDSWAECITSDVEDKDLTINLKGTNIIELRNKDVADFKTGSLIYLQKNKLKFTGDGSLNIMGAIGTSKRHAISATSGIEFNGTGTIIAQSAKFDTNGTTVITDDTQEAILNGNEKNVKYSSDYNLYLSKKNHPVTESKLNPSVWPTTDSWSYIHLRPAYDFKIAGVRMDEWNHGSTSTIIAVSEGKIKGGSSYKINYDPATNTVDMLNITIESNDVNGIFASKSPMTLKLAGDCKFTHNMKDNIASSAYIALNGITIDFAEGSKLTANLSVPNINQPAVASLRGTMYIQGKGEIALYTDAPKWTGSKTIANVGILSSGWKVWDAVGSTYQWVLKQPNTKFDWNVKTFFARYDVSADGIEGVTADTEITEDDTPLYNLNGVRVGKDYKGIVIKNGKKTLVK